MKSYNNNSSSMNSVSVSTSSSSPHSTISSHSLSSQHSNNSLSSSSSPIFPTTRCEGLDLLVKAVYFVAGSMIGVPFIQKRVIRRRRRRIGFQFRTLIESDDEFEENDDNAAQKKIGDEKIGEKLKVVVGMRKRREKMVLPLKYQDSVLQPWKRQSRNR